MITRRAIFPALAGAFSRAGAAVVLRASDGAVLRIENEASARSLAAPPGSVLKPWLLEALRPWRLRPCSMRLRIGGYRLDCAHLPLNAPLDAETALAASCNQWFAAAAAEADPAAVLRRLEECGASAARVSTPEQLQLQVLGLAHVSITPFLLALAFRRLALEAGPVIRSGLRRAVIEGTAQSADIPGLEIAGKTGTSPGAAWFAGFAPLSAPRFVVVVRQPGGRGGRDAAPVARELFAWAFDSGSR